MDSDNDGYISYKSIDLTHLTDAELQVFEPFFVQMEEKKERFTLYEFLERAN